MQTHSQERVVPRLPRIIALIGIAAVTLAGARPAAAALDTEPGAPGRLVLDRASTVSVAHGLRTGSAIATAVPVPAPVRTIATTTVPQRLTAVTPTTAPPTTAPPTTAPPTTAPPTTEAPPPPPPAPAPAPAPEAPSAPSVSSGSVWDQLAQCEAGGNWAINTGNGYYGGLQFTLSSWQGVGGSGYPHENSRETQIAMGQRLQASQGWGAWPACSAKLGLR